MTDASVELIKLRELCQSCIECSTQFIAITNPASLNDDMKGKEYHHVVNRWRAISILLKKMCEYSLDGKAYLDKFDENQAAFYSILEIDELLGVIPGNFPGYLDAMRARAFILEIISDWESEYR